MLRRNSTIPCIAKQTVKASDLPHSSTNDNNNDSDSTTVDIIVCTLVTVGCEFNNINIVRFMKERESMQKITINWDNVR
jgi:hypothetical protein